MQADLGQADSPVDTDALLAAFVSRAGRDDPYPVYRELLRRPALPRLGDGSLMITRFADCSAVLRSPDVGHSDDVGAGRVPDWRDHVSLLTFGTSLLGLDPPVHTRLRRLVSGAFTVRAGRRAPRRGGRDRRTSCSSTSTEKPTSSGTSRFRCRSR